MKIGCAGVARPGRAIQQREGKDPGLPHEDIPEAIAAARSARHLGQEDCGEICKAFRKTKGVVGGCTYTP